MSPAAVFLWVCLRANNKAGLPAGVLGETDMEYYHEKVETDSRVPARIYYGGTSRDKLRYPLHWHHNLEFDLVLEGCIRGRIGEKQVEIHPGEIFFVNSGELHETDARDNTIMRSVTVLLSDEMLREYCPDLENWYFSFEKGSPQQEKLAELILRCARIQQAREEFYELDLSVELRRICGVLLKECRSRRENQDSGQKRLSTRRVKKCISYMEKNYESPVSIRDMAQVMGMTPAYFSRFFHQSTGQTFHSYLTWIRLQHACRQLLQTEVTVMELALNNGFPNVKSFINAFQREYGMTPARFRREKSNSPAAEDISEKR